MKKFRFLFVIAFAFALFMVSNSVKADQIGPCNFKACYINFEKVNNLESITIDPERLTLSDGDSLYAIKVASKIGSTTYGNSFNFKIFDYENRDMSVVKKDYIPVSTNGQLEVTFDSNAMIINQADEAWVNSQQDATNYFTIGYLVIKSDYPNVALGVKFTDEFFSGSISDLTLSGIEYNKTNDAGSINVDVLFGDFKFNYIVTQYYNDKPAEGYWEPVTGNSDMITIDNSNSTDDLFCNFEYRGNSQISVKFTEYAPGMGDSIEGITPGYTSELVKLSANEKKSIQVDIFGGNETVAKEILQNSGKIGTISLTISNDRSVLEN